MSLKKQILKRFPGSLVLKGWLVAYRDGLFPCRNSYSQNGEDLIIESYLKGELRPDMIYVDVGANHPTRISNTYKLYKQGLSGVTVEPNRSLGRMHKRIRPRDIQIAIGCGASFDILEFQHSTSHVLSGFKSEGLKTNQVRRTEFLPICPLDAVMRHYADKEIAVLSIDVEGLDLEVAKGAIETLKRTRMVVIESDSSTEDVDDFFSKVGFLVHATTKHNKIYSKRPSQD